MAKFRFVYLFYISLAIYLIASSFDIGISYTFYKQNPDFFMNMESNQNLVGSLKVGLDFFQSVVIFIPYVFFVIICLYGILVYETDLIIKKKRFKILIVSVLIALLLIQSYRHISGGLSWII